MDELRGWLPAIGIGVFGVWLNLCLWAVNQKNPPWPFRLLLNAWNGIKEVLGVHRLNSWLAARSEHRP